jgi:Coenzyme PQQ synthesis protein D (PqqD)
MQTVVSRRREPYSAEIGAEIILMSVENGKYYGMGETGSDIWRRIEQPVRVDRLCSALSAEYAGDPATIAHDVIEFLDHCAADDLLEDVVTVPFGDEHCT